MNLIVSYSIKTKEEVSKKQIWAALPIAVSKFLKLIKYLSVILKLTSIRWIDLAFNLLNIF